MLTLSREQRRVARSSHPAASVQPIGEGSNTQPLQVASCLVVGDKHAVLCAVVCADVMEAAFLVLDTLALANRDVAAVVTQQRLNALSNLLVQLPMDQLLQQQTLGLAWINSMAAAVSRNKQVLESMAGVDPVTGQPAVSAGLLQSAVGG